MELILFSFLLMIVFGTYLLVLFRKAKNESSVILSLDEVNEIKGALEDILLQIEDRSEELMRRVEEAEAKLELLEKQKSKLPVQPEEKSSVLAGGEVIEPTWVFKPEHPLSHGDIGQLHQEGMDFREIAQRAGKKTGEIELMIGLQRIKKN